LRRGASGGLSWQFRSGFGMQVDHRVTIWDGI